MRVHLHLCSVLLVLGTVVSGCGGGTLATSALAPASPLTVSQKQQIDALFQQQITNNIVPGVQLGIAKDRALVYAQGYGLANLANQTPVTTNTTFQIGSVSKQFAATCILILLDRGLIASIDDPVTKYVPELTVAGRNGVTLREMLDMDSGLAANVHMVRHRLI